MQAWRVLAPSRGESSWALPRSADYSEFSRPNRKVAHWASTAKLTRSRQLNRPIVSGTCHALCGSTSGMNIVASNSMFSPPVPADGKQLDVSPDEMPAESRAANLQRLNPILGLWSKIQGDRVVWGDDQVGRTGIEKRLALHPGDDDWHHDPAG